MLESQRLTLNTKRLIYAKKLKTQTVESNEYFFNPGWFNLKETTLYSLQSTDHTFDAENNLTVYGILIYAEDNIVNNSREIYNSLDLLGDVGGLMEGLKLISGALISLVGQGSLTRWLISQLFFRSPSSSQSDDAPFQNNNSPPQTSMLKVLQAFKYASSLKKVKARCNLDCIFNRCSSSANRRAKMLDKGISRVSN